MVFFVILLFLYMVLHSLTEAMVLILPTFYPSWNDISSLTLFL